MNPQVNQYLQALATFVHITTRAAMYVQHLYSPEEPLPTATVSAVLRSYYAKYLKPALKGLDPHFVRELRQLYDAHITDLKAGYSAFYIANSSPNRRTSTFANEVHKWAERSLSKYVDWATEITTQLLLAE